MKKCNLRGEANVLHASFNHKEQTGLLLDSFGVKSSKAGSTSCSKVRKLNDEGDNSHRRHKFLQIELDLDAKQEIFFNIWGKLNLLAFF